MTTRVVHKHKGAFDVYIGRPSKWGNPYSHKAGTLAQFRVASREEAIVKYRAWLLAQPELVAAARTELKGKVLGCWCAPLPCHGDVLAEIVDTPKAYKPATCVGARYTLPWSERPRLMKCARMLEDCGYTLRSGAAEVGGTAQALRIAKAYGIPIYNLADRRQGNALARRLRAEMPGSGC